MDVLSYLNRIGLDQIEKPTLDFLKRIHFNHLKYIPFENQEIYSFNRCTLNPKRLYNKMILKHEGGICYQLNYMLYRLLRKIGYRVEILSAYVEETEYDHMFLKVIIDNKNYLCDVGYGLNFLYPLPFEINQEIRDPRGKFSILKEDSSYVLKATFNHDNNSYIQYQFKNIKKTKFQFKKRVRYYSHSENSRFKKDLIIIKENLDSRVVLKNTNLKSGFKNPTTTKLDMDNFSTYVKETIGINIYSRTLEKLQIKINA